MPYVLGHKDLTMRKLLVQFKLNSSYLVLRLNTIPTEPIVVFQQEKIIGIMKRDNPHLDWVINGGVAIHQMNYTVIMEQ